MKKIVLMVVGAVALYQAAKKYGVNSFQDAKDLVMKYVKSLNLNELVNLDKIKSMVGMDEEVEELATV